MVVHGMYGNTCRSPMAEALLAICSPNDYAAHFAEGQPSPAVAVSAGLSAFPAVPHHRSDRRHEATWAKSDSPSKPCGVMIDLLMQADLVLTMTRSLTDKRSCNAGPDLAKRTALLIDNNGDVSRPVLVDRSSVYAALCGTN